MQIGLSGAVFLVLLVLKLLGVITWSWWIVTAPLWFVPALLITAGFGLALIAALFPDK